MPRKAPLCSLEGKQKIILSYSWEIIDYRSISGDILLDDCSVRDWPAWERFFQKMSVSVRPHRTGHFLCAFALKVRNFVLRALMHQALHLSSICPWPLNMSATRKVSELSDCFEPNEKRCEELRLLGVDGSSGVDLYTSDGGVARGVGISLVVSSYLDHS